MVHCDHRATNRSGRQSHRPSIAEVLQSLRPTMRLFAA
jgi:hypothetical protein